MHKKISFFLIFLAISSILGLLFYGPIYQWASYHDFADKGLLCGVPNFMNTVSNIAFLLAGIFVLFNLKNYPSDYRFFFIAMGLSMFFLFAGSAFYHLDPSDLRLVWDKLPIASFFSLLFLQIVFELKLFEFTKRNFNLAILYWLLSCASVFVWFYTTDLRMYAFAQFFPLVSVLILIPICFVIGQNRKAILFSFLIGGYVLAKIFEKFDYQTLMLTNGLISGHTIAGLAILGYFYIYKKFAIKS